jgi:hypothetical protein
MKGVIPLALREMILKQFGAEKWKEVLHKAGMAQEPLLLAVGDVEDPVVLKMVHSVCQVLNLSLVQAADAFGDYWVNVYSQKAYRRYYEKCKNAKEFLLQLNSIHQTATQNLPGARPPQFEFQPEGDQALVLTYKSPRGMIDFAVGLIKGVGHFYHENLRITKIAANKVRVVFS